MIEKLKDSFGIGIAYGYIKDSFGIGIAYGYIIYITGCWLTLVYLIFFDGFRYNAWNWIIVIPIDMFLSMIWPIYWSLLHWIRILH